MPADDDFYTPTDIDALRMENELLAFEVRFLKDRLSSGADQQPATGSLERPLDRGRLLSELETKLAEATRSGQAGTAELLERLLDQARQLADREERLSEKNRQLESHDQRLSEKNRQLAEVRRALAHESRQLETLTRWMEEMGVVTTALLGSRQWKAGRALGELSRRAALRPRTPTTVEDHLNSVMRRFNEWRQGYKRPVLQTPETSVEEPPSDLAPAEPSAPTSLSREELADEVRKRLGPVPELAAWPRISVIVSNRNGLIGLEKLFSGLKERTDYPDFEVVLVDGGSTDGSVELAKHFDAPFPIKLIENAHDASLVEVNNRGAGLATGELLLFVRNDVEPFEPGWLKEMVSRVETSEAGAVGAYLVHTGKRGSWTASGYAVRHRGIKFRKVSDREEYGSVRPFDLGEGEDAIGEHLGGDLACPAASGACLLIGRSTFNAVGGFTTGYRFGDEDVDLGLKVLALGREVVSSGRAMLLREEPGLQSEEEARTARINDMGNRRLLRERWGPRLHREYEVEHLTSGDFWAEEGAHVAITVSSKNAEDGYGDWYTGHEMGDALERLGWRVTYVQRKDDDWYSLPDDLDYLLVLLETFDVSRVPEGVTTIAWIRNWTERWIEQPWFERFDVVLASSGISVDLVEQRTNKKAHFFPIATNPERFSRTPPNPTYEADYVFTGSHWGAARGIVENLDVAPEETFMVFGKGWENVPRLARYARGDVPYDELPRVYSSAKLVVDDAARSTLPYGSVNSRVFDALATGTLVVTNCEAGVRELFDEDFPAYADRHGLRANLDLLLGDEQRRHELAERYREVVLREHTYRRRAEQFRELLRERAEALGFCIKIGAPSWNVAPSWGDLHYARAIQRHLERRGYRCLIQVLDEWDNSEGLEYDVAVHLKGLTLYVPKPSQFNVLWNISHPGRLTAGECDRYDLVFVASERWAEWLRPRTSTPVVVLEQATDPEVFFPDPDPEHEHELVFVGNSRKVRRRILRDLLPTERDLAVWGGDWEGLINEKHLAGHYLPNAEVRKAYSSASIVLNDHWDDMREHGFISNRIYDALACGALVISDDLPELEERFRDAVVTYRSPEELRRLVDHYLDSPEERAEKGRRGRELVLTGHTFGHRADVLLGEIERCLEESAFRKRILPQDHEPSKGKNSADGFRRSSGGATG